MGPKQTQVNRFAAPRGNHAKKVLKILQFAAKVQPNEQNPNLAHGRTDVIPT